MSTAPWPVEIKLDKPKTSLTVVFDNGDRFALAAEYLRIESPSAEVQGHAAAQKVTVGGKKTTLGAYIADLLTYLAKKGPAAGVVVILATQFVRSIGQGALAVDFAPYLHALDRSAGPSVLYTLREWY